MQRIESREILELAHLLYCDLAQGAVRRKGYEIGVRCKQQRVLIAFVGRPLLALRDDVAIRFQAEIVELDFFRAAHQRRGEAPDQSSLSHPFGSIEQQCLRNALLLRHREERLGNRAIAMKIAEHE